MSSKSLADSAVETLAAISAMDQGVTNDNPDRHIIRNLKQVAQNIVRDALHEAHSLAFIAEDVRNLGAPSAQPAHQGEGRDTQ